MQSTCPAGAVRHRTIELFCLLLALSGHFEDARECPLSGGKAEMSAHSRNDVRAERDGLRFRKTTKMCVGNGRIGVLPN